jgi:hypothetical protein
VPGWRDDGAACRVAASCPRLGEEWRAPCAALGSVAGCAHGNRTRLFERWFELLRVTDRGNRMVSSRPLRAGAARLRMRGGRFRVPLYRLPPDVVTSTRSFRPSLG